MPAKKGTAKRGKAPAAKAESVPVEPKADASPLDETFVVDIKNKNSKDEPVAENGSYDEPKVGNGKTDSDVAEPEASKKKAKTVAKKTKEKPAEKVIEDEPADDKDDAESTCEYCSLITIFQRHRFN